ncbi:MAG: SPFH domain-containing protein [Alphaproteobacteria bacterium]|nr:SPFH domain-containing protein [Alphaproteobacteria bacterium]
MGGHDNKEVMSFWGKTKDIAKNAAKHPIVVLCSLAALGLAYRSYKIVPAQSYGVRVTFGQMVSDNVPPGFYFKYPLYDTIDIFSNNTVIVESEVGAVKSSGSSSENATELNSSDRNPVSAKIRTHYKVNPAVGSIALKLPEMRGDNGETAFKELENQSFNAVVGSRPAAETLDDPTGFLEAFLVNLRWRLAQNNMPIEIDTIELLSFHANLRKPIQYRIKSDGKVDQMAGPAAVSVTHGGKQSPVVPVVTVPARPGEGKATRSVAPKPSTTTVAP